MKLLTEQFVALLRSERISLLLLAMEMGITVAELKRMLSKGEPFDYWQSKQLLAMFGADAMIPVIDWEALNVRCPI